MRDNLKALLKRLLECEIDFVLVGGLACTVHGSPLVTQDLDICISINQNEISKLRTALKDLSPRHRMNPSFKPSFLDHPEVLDDVKNIYLETDLGILDILSELDPIGDFETAKKRAVQISIYGYQCHVVSIEDLIRIKKTMTRPRDKETIQYLKKILTQLKGSGS